MGKKTWILGGATVIATTAMLLSAPAQARDASVYVQIGTPGYVVQHGGYYHQPAYPGLRGHRPHRGPDRDRDGVPDRFDRDLDNDGRANHRDRDRDGDGVPNRWDRRPDNRYRH